MAATLAFDVYGTLIDTHGVVSLLQTMVGDGADAFSRAWRDKQLEYAFRRGLMQNYVDFATCTRHALEHTCAARQVQLQDEQKHRLLQTYRRLPPYTDVAEGLKRLQQDGFRQYAFSNGSKEAVEGLLDAAGIREFFLDVVSVDALRTFKPNPAVYCYFLRESGALGRDAWLISSNPFDVIGAISAGMRGAWLQRSPDAVFDPWGIQPTVTVGGISSKSFVPSRRRCRGRRQISPVPFQISPLPSNAGDWSS